MGKFDMAQATTAAEKTPQLFVIYGREGVGKTWFACSFPGLFILALEGLSGVPEPLPGHFPEQPKNLRELLEALDAFEARPTDGKGAKYKYLAIDSTTELELMVQAQTLAEEGSSHLDEKEYKVSWTKMRAVWDKLLARLAQLQARTGVHVVLLGHAEQPKEFAGQEGAPKWDLRVDPKVRDRIKAKANHVLFLDWDAQIAKAKKGQRAILNYRGRLLRTRESGQWVAKTRSGMPDSVPATYEDLVRALQQAAPASPDKLRAQIAEIAATLAAPARAEIETAASKTTDPKALARLLSRASSLLTVQREQEGDGEEAGEGEAAPESGETRTASTSAQDPEPAPKAAPAPAPAPAPESPADHAAAAAALVQAAQAGQLTAAQALGSLAKLTDLSDTLRVAYAAEIRKGRAA